MQRNYSKKVCKKNIVKKCLKKCAKNYEIYYLPLKSKKKSCFIDIVLRNWQDISVCVVRCV